MSPRVVAATIVARNYLPFALVLAESYLAHHPDHRFAILVTDDTAGKIKSAGASWELVRLREIGLPAFELERMAVIYDVMELATAVKPWLLGHLLRESEVAVYLDPDICVYAPLVRLDELAMNHDVVLTPHRLNPVENAAAKPTEFEILGSGTFNLGFIAVSRGAAPMLEWWGDRLLRHAIVDPPTMHFTDQRWVDLVPAYFRHHIIRDEGWNVAYWNLQERPLSHESGTFRAGARPLRFFHFSGFQPDAPLYLSKHQGDHPRRIRVDSDPVLSELCAAYASRLVGGGYQADRASYGFASTPTGRSLEKRVRRAYRAGLLASEGNGAEEPPNPLLPEESALFDEWLTADLRGAAGINPYVMELYDELNMATVFPNVLGDDRRRYLRWVVLNSDRLDISKDLIPNLDATLITRGFDTAQAIVHEFPSMRGFEKRVRRIRAHFRRARRLPHRLRVIRHRRRQRRRFSSGALTEGVNVAGFLRAESGVGEAARAMLAVMEAADVPYATVDYSQTLNRQLARFAARDKGAPYDLNLVSVNGDALRHFAIEVGPEFFRDRYTIALWHIELDCFPEGFRPAIEYTDEIWCSSEFGAAGARRASDRPVRVFPLPVVRPNPPPVSREALRLPPGRTVFLFFFDFFSVMERKNPLGLIAAFKSAFSESDGAFLLIKTINGGYRPRQLSTLRAAASARNDIEIRDEYLDSEVRFALMSQCDAYVSLHRAEGFGLTLAESMSLGTPVVATGYSGNLEFMTPQNSLLVPFSLTRVPRGCAPYPSGATWASPDLDAAARLMRQIFEKPEEAAQRASLARKDIELRHSARARADLLRRHLDAARTAASLPAAKRVSEVADRLVLKAQRDLWSG